MAINWIHFTWKVLCAAKLLAVIPGGNGVTAGASTPAHSANMLVLATLMLTTVEAAPLAVIVEAPPLSGLLSDLEVTNSHLHDQDLLWYSTRTPSPLTICQPNLPRNAAQSSSRAA